MELKMKAVLGVDVGGSTTKIVGFEGDRLLGKLQVKAADQVTSMYGALGNFLQKYRLSLGDISLIVLTGVGADYFEGDIYGIKTCKAKEFRSIGYGGLYLSDCREAFVVSLGTGTAIVRATQTEITHIGGSGVGGGTLIGLASKMLGKNDIESILKTAENGRLEYVDLTVGEITKAAIPSLPPNTTAANFGKIKSTATDADFALGIINMVLQTVGMMAVFAARGDSIRNIVLTGSLAALPHARKILEPVQGMYDVKLTIPEDAAFATAIGAAIPFLELKV